MKIQIHNNCEIPNKYMRLLKWKLYNLKEKFTHMLYANVHVNVEGTGLENYHVNLILGIPGNNIILKEKSTNISEIIANLVRSAHRYLRKTKNRII